MKVLVTRNTHVQYEIPIPYGKKVMAKVKVFVHASNADADTRAMTLAPRTFCPGSLETYQNYFPAMNVIYTQNIHVCSVFPTFPINCSFEWQKIDNILWLPEILPCYTLNKFTISQFFKSKPYFSFCLQVSTAS